MQMGKKCITCGDVQLEPEMVQRNYISILGSHHNLDTNFQEIMDQYENQGVVEEVDGTCDCPNHCKNNKYERVTKITNVPSFLYVVIEDLKSERIFFPHILIVESGDTFTLLGRIFSTRRSGAHFYSEYYYEGEQIKGVYHYNDLLHEGFAQIMEDPTLEGSKELNPILLYVKNKCLVSSVSNFLSKDIALPTLKQHVSNSVSTDLAFPPLTEDMEATVSQLLSPGNGLVVSGFNVDLQKQDIHTLKAGVWVNDEIINFYGQLIMERARNNSSTYPDIHIFNSFFYTNLVQGGYGRVKRWTKNIEVFTKDYIIIPVHLGMHWVCSVINLKKKRFEYYDSLHGGGSMCLNVLREYLKKESKSKRGIDLNLSEWNDYIPKDIPSQNNGCDCGIFTSIFMEYVASELDFDFGQSQMNYFRRMMVWEISQKKLISDCNFVVERTESNDCTEYCICKRPDDGLLMVECSFDGCKMWFHGACVGFLKEIEVPTYWLCLECRNK